MSTSQLRLIRFTCVVCGLLVYVYPLSLPTPLLDPDEGLHAAIAQEMVESDDYLIPRFMGEPFRDKPIVYFLAQAVSLRFLGMHEPAVRLPGFVFAVLGVITTWMLALRLFDRATADVGSLLLVTMLAPVVLAQSAAHDIALVPFTNLLLICLWESHRNAAGSRSRFWCLSGSVAVALAVLTKGLIGVAVISCGYVGWVIFERQQSMASLLRFGWILAVGGMIALPWFVTFENASPGYLRYYFFDRHVLGFTTSTQTHGTAAWYYYVPIVLIGTSPWMWFAFAGLGESMSNEVNDAEQHSHPSRFTLCWLIGGLLFLSVAKSKLITYTLPLYPAMAILAAVTWVRFLDGRASEQVRRRFSFLYKSGALTGALIPFAIILAVSQWSEVELTAINWIAATLVSGISVGGAVLFLRQQYSAALAASGLWMAALIASTLAGPFQPISNSYSGRSLAANIAGKDLLHGRIVVVGHRMASLVFYLPPEARQRLQSHGFVEAHPQDLTCWSRVPPGDLLVITPEAVKDTRNPMIRQAAEQSVLVDGCYLIDTFGPGTCVGSVDAQLRSHEQRNVHEFTIVGH